MTDKEIDKKIHDILGNKTYDVRCELQLVDDESEGLDLSEAQSYVGYLKKQYPNIADSYTVTSSRYVPIYSNKLHNAVMAAKQLSDSKGFTFVLTYNNKENWRAAFGDYKDCEEVEDSNPAKATCLAIIKFMETL